MRLLCIFLFYLVAITIKHLVFEQNVLIVSYASFMSSILTINVLVHSPGERNTYVSVETRCIGNELQPFNRNLKHCMYIYVCVQLATILIVQLACFLIFLVILIYSHLLMSLLFIVFLFFKKLLNLIYIYINVFSIDYYWALDC